VAASQYQKKEVRRENPMNVGINTNLRNLVESATLAINQTAIQRRKQGEEVFHFGFGQSPFPVPVAIEHALKQAAASKEYLPTRGLTELHEKFVEYYNGRYQTQLKSDNIFVGPGSKELIFQLLYLLEGSLIVPAPSWVSYVPQAQLLDKRVATVVTEKSSGYKLTPGQLQAVCKELGKKQKILILNSPNNPTGSIYSSEEIIALTGVCRANDVVLISDEIYGLVDFDGVSFESMARYYPEGTIVSTGLSKGFSAGGYRLGMMGIPDHMQNLIEAFKTLVSETFSCVSSPIQYAALAAYSPNEDQDLYIRACTQIHRLASTYLYRRLKGMGAGCVEPTGAVYIFPDFEAFKGRLTGVGIRTGSKLCRCLLNEYQVALLPGSAFYMPEGSLTVRMASVDYDGIAAIRAHLDGHELNDEFVARYFPNLIKGSDALARFLESLG
jgi:aspartate aminotransferase